MCDEHCPAYTRSERRVTTGRFQLREEGFWRKRVVLYVEVKGFVGSPLTGGSRTTKKWLPATLAESMEYQISAKKIEPLFLGGR